MSLNKLETEIWHECQTILQNPKMRKKDLLEWSIGAIEPRDGEISIWVDRFHVNAVVLSTLDHRNKE